MGSPKKTVRLTVDVPQDAYELIESLANEIHTSKSDVLRRGLALMKVAVEAQKEGKKFGVAEPGQELSTEIVGIY